MTLATCTKSELCSQSLRVQPLFPALHRLVVLVADKYRA